MEGDVIANDFNMSATFSEVERAGREISSISKEDQKLSSLGNTEAFETLKGLIQEEIQALQDDLAGSLSGKTVAEVGVRYLVASLVEERLNRIIKKVEATTKYVNDEVEARRQKNK